MSPPTMRIATPANSKACSAASRSSSKSMLSIVAHPPSPKATGPRHGDASRRHRFEVARQYVRGHDRRAPADRITQGDVMTDITQTLERLAPQVAKVLRQ